MNARLAVDLGAGRVALGPVGVLLVRRALASVEHVGRRDGVAPPADFVELRRVLDQAAAQARTFAAETRTAQVTAPDESTKAALAVCRADSCPGPPGGLASFTGSTVGATEVARLLDCSEQWARTRLRRGEFVSARRRRSGRWEVDRDEVLARLGDDDG